MRQQNRIIISMLLLLCLTLLMTGCNMINPKQNIQSQNETSNIPSATSNSSTESMMTTSQIEDTYTEAEINEDEYVSEVINEAENVFGDELDYDSALKIIKNAQQKFPQNELLLEQESYYMQFLPVKIFDLSPFTNSGDKLSREEKAEDNMGNIYSDCLTSYGSRWEVHDIGKNYNTLTGTLAVEKYAKHTSSYSIKFKIYGDERLLWESDEIDDSNKPIDISVDITGITDLKIETDSSWAYLEIIFANAVLQRTEK